MLNTPAHHRARAHDPVTSVLTAENAVHFAGSHADRIHAALRRVGPCTPHALTSVTGLTVVQIDRRLPEMKTAGRASVVQEDGEDKIVDGFRVWQAI